MDEQKRRMLRSAGVSELMIEHLDERDRHLALCCEECGRPIAPEEGSPCAGCVYLRQRAEEESNRVPPTPEFRSGAAYRYQKRLARFRADGRPFPWARHFGWWLLHNAVAHPVLALFPARPALWLHDWTSQRLNQKKAIRPSPPPEIKRPLAWVVHNAVAHLAIGLFPCEATFELHDETADWMAVEDWV